MKKSELRALPAEGLKAELLELRKEQFNLRIQQKSGQMVKPHLFDKARKQIARIKTLLTEFNATKGGKVS
jgi:large subunit ribosomal protein L29